MEPKTKLNVDDLPEVKRSKLERTKLSLDDLKIPKKPITKLSLNDIGEVKNKEPELEVPKVLEKVPVTPTSHKKVYEYDVIHNGEYLKGFDTMEDFIAFFNREYDKVYYAISMYTNLRNNNNEYLLPQDMRTKMRGVFILRKNNL